MVDLAAFHIDLDREPSLNLKFLATGGPKLLLRRNW